MTESVTFSLSEPPQGKGRARTFINPHTKRVVTTTPEKTRTYEGMIRSAAMDAMRGRERLEGPISVVLRVVFDIPASYSQKKREACLRGEIKPAKKPDWDNIAKAVFDGICGVVYRDDAQIVMAECSKVYGPAPLVAVIVRAA